MNASLYSACTVPMQTRILSDADVRSLLQPAAAIEAVERAFAEHGRGETLMPPKLYLPLPGLGGDFRAMPVCAGDRAGLKWVNAHPDNPQRHGLPSVMAVFLYNDPQTGAPLAVLAATFLTRMRTGAAAAVATRYLARPNAGTLGLIGCGAQASMVLACHRETMKLRKVWLYDKDARKAETLAAEFPDLDCRVTSLRQAALAEVVCTMTPSRQPFLARSLVQAGTHINALGADAKGKQELDPAILLDARVFLDDEEQGKESGEVNVPLRQGILPPDAIAGTLGQVVAGRLAGRAETALTVFDSTGLAVQDLAVARLVYEEACRKDLGIKVDLVGPTPGS